MGRSTISMAIFHSFWYVYPQDEGLSRRYKIRSRQKVEKIEKAEMAETREVRRGFTFLTDFSKNSP
jgi:hypothetical protein